MHKVLNLTLHNAQIDFYGFLRYSDDIDYWINNVWHIPALQNQSIGLAFLGNDFVLDGHGTGGLDGNGQVWYEYGMDRGNVDGRYVLPFSNPPSLPTAIPLSGCHARTN